MTDFKQLWQSQPTVSTSATEIIAKAQRLQKSIRNKMLLGNALLAATLWFIIAIVWHYQPSMVTTKIGTLLVALAIVMQILASAKMIPLFSKGNTLSSSADFLEQMLSLKKKQAFLQTTIMGLYFVLLGTGIFLYLYEYAQRMATLGFVLSYALTGLWIAFSWFYLRPRTIKKQQIQLNEIIENLQDINNQLKEPDL